MKKFHRVSILTICFYGMFAGVNGAAWADIVSAQDWLTLSAGSSALDYLNGKTLQFADDTTLSINGNGVYTLSQTSSSDTDANVVKMAYYDNDTNSVATKNYTLGLKSAYTSGTQQKNVNGTNGGKLNVKYNNTGSRQTVEYNTTTDKLNTTLNGLSATQSGGALKTEGTITNMDGIFIANTTTKSGGGIANIASGANIVNANGIFIGNSADESGGAIVNDRGTITNLVASFIGNTANVSGGAIFNGAANGGSGSATINNIMGDFVGNISGSFGGAIYNNNSTINNIVGTFIGNSSDNGGAIYNTQDARIENITGNFISNQGTNQGAAIYNNATIGSISGNFINNTGGSAIYNTGTINEISGIFIGNSGTHGGAIKTSTNINIVANGADTVFQDNNKDNNNVAIYLDPGAALTLDAKNNGNIYMYDMVSGPASSVYNVTLKSTDGTGTIHLFNGFDNKANVNVLANTKINMVDNQIFNYQVNQITSDQTATYALDIKASTKEADTIKTNVASSGKITISDINWIDETGIDSGSWRVKILNTQNNSLQLELADNLKSTFLISQQGAEIVPSFVDDPITDNATFDKVFNKTEIITTTYAKDIMGQLVLATTNTTNDSLQVKITEQGGQSTTTTGSVTSLGDTLQLWAENNTGATKVFSATNTVPSYSVTDSTLTDITVAGNQVNVVGKTGSIMNLNNATLVLDGTDSKNTTLSFENIRLTGNATSLLNIGANESVVFNNSTVDGNVFNNGTYTTDGNVISGIISGNGTTIFTSDMTLDNNSGLASTQSIVANGDLDIGTCRVTVANAELKKSLKMQITDIDTDSDDYAGGQLNVANTLTLGKGAKLSLTVANGVLDSGETSGDLALINAGKINGKWGDIFEENLRYDITMTDDGKFKITNARDIVDMNLNANNIQTAAAFDKAKFTTGSDLQTVQNALNELSQHDLAGYQRALSDIAPTDSQIVMSDVMSITNILSRWIERGGTIIGRGRSGGEVPYNGRVWMDVIGASAHQSGNMEHSEFNSHTLGAVFGFNNQISKNTRIGIGYAYHNTNADSGARDMDISGVTLFTHARYQWGSPYLRGMAGYNSAKYKENTSVVGMNITADYNVYATNAEAFLGFETKYLTPEIGMRYTHISRDNYHDSLGQSVKTKDMNVLTAMANMRYAYDYKVGDGYVKPTLQIGTTYDMISDDMFATVGAGNMSYVVTGESLDKLGFTGGAGVMFEYYDWNFGLEYSLDWRQDYKEHSGSLSIKYNF